MVICGNPVRLLLTIVLALVWHSILLCEGSPRIKDCSSLYDEDITRNVLIDLVNCKDGILIASPGVELFLENYDPKDVFEVLKHANVLKMSILSSPSSSNVIHQHPWNLSLDHLDCFEKTAGRDLVLDVVSNPLLMEIHINESWVPRGKVLVKGNPILSRDSIAALRRWADPASYIQPFGECVFNELVVNISAIANCIHMSSDLILQPRLASDISMVPNNISFISGCLRVVNTNLDSLDFLDLKPGAVGLYKCISNSTATVLFSEVSKNFKLCVYPRLQRHLETVFNATVENNAPSSCYSTCHLSDLTDPSKFDVLKDKEIQCLTLVGDVIIRNFTEKQPWFEHLEKVEEIVNGSLYIEYNNLSFPYFSSLKRINLTSAQKGVGVRVRNNTNFALFDLPKLVEITHRTEAVAAIEITDNEGLTLAQYIVDRFNRVFTRDFVYTPYKRPGPIVNPPLEFEGHYLVLPAIATFCVMFVSLLIVIIWNWMRDYESTFWLPQPLIATDPVARARLLRVIMAFIDLTTLEHRQRHGRCEDRQLRYYGPRIRRGRDAPPIEEQISEETRKRHRSKLDIMTIFAADRVDPNRVAQTIAQMKKFCKRESDYFVCLAGYPDPAQMIIGLCYMHVPHIYRQRIRTPAVLGPNGDVVTPAVRDRLLCRLLDTEIYNDHLCVYTYHIEILEDGELTQKTFKLVNFTGWIYRTCPQNSTTLLSFIALATQRPITFIAHANNNMGFSLIALDSMYQHITRPELDDHIFAEINQIVAFALGHCSDNTKMWLWTMDCLLHWADRSNLIPPEKAQEWADWKVVWRQYYDYIDRLPAQENPDPLRLKLPSAVFERMKGRGLRPQEPMKNWGDEEEPARPVPMWMAAGLDEGPDVYTMFPELHPEDIEYPTPRTIKRIDRGLLMWKRRHGGEAAWTEERYLEAARGSESDRGEDDDEEWPIHNILE